MGKFKKIKLGDIAIRNYNYRLPDEKIAKYPMLQRDQSKLLVWKNHSIEDHIFSEIPDLLPSNSLLIFNNTKVIRARILFKKITGAHIEIFCLDPYKPTDYQVAFQQKKSCTWKCMIGNKKKWKDGKLKKTLFIQENEIELIAEKIYTKKNENIIHFSWNNSDFEFSRIIENAGILPIPPYLNRDTEESDILRYQTVYSKIRGSVAAPTAGLHFTEEVLARVKEKGHKIQELTLHVGAGTFQPVKSETIENHEMHSEQIYISQQLLENLLAHNGPKIAIGTTTIRTLESIYWLGCQVLSGDITNTSSLKISQWEPYKKNNYFSVKESIKALVLLMQERQTDHLSASTQIIILPGYKFQMIDGMLTNFHQPQSTLLLLVSAFLGENWKFVYNHALNNDYRFLSYGDSNLYLK